jgi:pimeloyl-ACP methyl ester carboxylesterase
MSDVPLHVVRLGSSASPPLILLHGWQQSLESLRPLGELLAENADVYLIDLPGFGRSGEPDAVWGVEDYARRIVGFLDEQKIEGADFVGHSFGGKTSIYLAAMFPDRVRRLVLIDSSGIPAVPSFKKRLRILWIKVLRGVLKPLQQKFNFRLYETWFIPRYASRDYRAAGSLRNTFVKVVNENLAELLPKIQVPTLLLWGDLDTETPLEVGRRMHQAIRDSELIVLEGKDHFPYLGSGAALCAFHIRRFLAKADHCSGRAHAP